MYRFHVFMTSNQSSFPQNIYFVISKRIKAYIKVEMKTR